MSAVLRAGVVGAGVFGGYHAAQYARREDVRLAAVFDSHPERAEALAAKHGARARASLEELLGEVDLVSIAAPATAHASLALACIAAGKPTYVEKPIATKLEDADAVVAAAGASAMVVACGLLERAVAAAAGLHRIAERPILIEAERLALPSPRCLDVSVVLDLMIHDLDLALTLAAGEPLAVEAQGARLANPRLDEASAEAIFTCGLVARVTASRAAAERRRRWRLVYPSGAVEIDLLTRTLINDTPFHLNAAFADAPAARDPLGASLDAFLAAARGQGRPLADAAAGARALDLALAVERAAEED